MRSRDIKIFSISIGIIQLLVFVLFAISIFTILSSFVSSLMTGEGNEPFAVKFNSPGEAVFVFDAKNSGLLESKMRLRIGIIPEGKILVEQEKSIKLKPKEEGKMEFVFNLTEDQVKKATTLQSKVTLLFECRTIHELVGVGVKLEVGGIK